MFVEKKICSRTTWSHDIVLLKYKEKQSYLHQHSYTHDVVDQFLFDNDRNIVVRVDNFDCLDNLINGDNVVVEIRYVGTMVASVHTLDRFDHEILFWRISSDFHHLFRLDRFDVFLTGDFSTLYLNCTLRSVRSFCFFFLIYSFLKWTSAHEKENKHERMRDIRQWERDECVI